ncbi:Auxin-responsive protein SAUR36-like protein [Drosera capensis]
MNDLPACYSLHYFTRPSPNHSLFYSLAISFCIPRNASMISSKKLIKLARKWQKLTSLRRKRISWSQSATTMGADPCSGSSTTDKGHFVVYSIDGRRLRSRWYTLGIKLLLSFFRRLKKSLDFQETDPSRWLVMGFYWIMLCL